MGAARATLTREDSEYWSRKFERALAIKAAGLERGGVVLFSKAASKGLPSPLNVAGWRCSNLCNVTPSLISQNPRNRMCSTQISFLVITFPSHISWVLTSKTIHQNPIKPHILAHIMLSLL